MAEPASIDEQNPWPHRWLATLESWLGAFFCTLFALGVPAIALMVAMEAVSGNTREGPAVGWWLIGGVALVVPFGLWHTLAMWLHVRWGEHPAGLTVAQRFARRPAWARWISIPWWILAYSASFGGALYTEFAGPSGNESAVFIFFIVFVYNLAANAYLASLVGAVTGRPRWVAAAWRHRLLVDVLLALAPAIVTFVR